MERHGAKTTMNFFQKLAFLDGAHSFPRYSTELQRALFNLAKALRAPRTFPGDLSERDKSALFFLGNSTISLFSPGIRL